MTFFLLLTVLIFYLLAGPCNPLLLTVLDSAIGLLCHWKYQSITIKAILYVEVTCGLACRSLISKFIIIIIIA